MATPGPRCCQGLLITFLKNPLANKRGTPERRSSSPSHTGRTELLWEQRSLLAMATADPFPETPPGRLVRIPRVPASTRHGSSLRSTPVPGRSKAPLAPHYADDGTIGVELAGPFPSSGMPGTPPTVRADVLLRCALALSWPVLRKSLGSLFVLFLTPWGVCCFFLNELRA